MLLVLEQIHYRCHSQLCLQCHDLPEHPKCEDIDHFWRGCLQSSLPFVFLAFITLSLCDIFDSLSGYLVLCQMQRHLIYYACIVAYHLKMGSRSSGPAQDHYPSSLFVWQPLSQAFQQAQSTLFVPSHSSDGQPRSSLGQLCLHGYLYESSRCSFILLVLLFHSLHIQRRCCVME